MLLHALQFCSIEVVFPRNFIKTLYMSGVRSLLADTKIFEYGI